LTSSTGSSRARSRTTSRYLMDFDELARRIQPPQGLIRDEWHQHKNPDGSIGGWIENTAHVATTAYVGPDALVLNSAEILDHARLLDSACASGWCVIPGQAIVSEQGKVTDAARVGGQTVVRGDTVIRGDTVLKSATYGETPQAPERRGMRPSAAKHSRSC